MKHVLQIILIVALLSLGIIQIMIAKGFFIPGIWKKSARSMLSRW